MSPVIASIGVAEWFEEAGEAAGEKRIRPCLSFLSSPHVPHRMPERRCICRPLRKVRVPRAHTDRSQAD